MTDLKNIRMDEELHRRLKIQAAANSTTMAGIIEKALDALETVNRQTGNEETVIVSKSTEL